MIIEYGVDRSYAAARGALSRSGSLLHRVDAAASRRTRRLVLRVCFELVSRAGSAPSQKRCLIVRGAAFGSVRAGRKERAQLIRAQGGRLRLLWRDPTGAVSKFPLFLLEYFDWEIRS